MVEVRSFPIRDRLRPNGKAGAQSRTTRDPDLQFDKLMKNRGRIGELMSHEIRFIQKQAPP